jgi:hypothetical protein
MKASVLYIHARDPRMVLAADSKSYFIVQVRERSALARTDVLSGDLKLKNVKWLFNITRGTLVDVTVLSTHKTAKAAIDAVARLPALSA